MKRSKIRGFSPGGGKLRKRHKKKRGRTAATTTPGGTGGKESIKEASTIPKDFLLGGVTKGYGKKKWCDFVPRDIYSHRGKRDQVFLLKKKKQKVGRTEKKRTMPPYIFEKKKVRRRSRNLEKVHADQKTSRGGKEKPHSSSS